jgi:hypothetical protein
VALLVLQKTPSCLDGSSSSTHSNKHQPLWIFFSLNLDDLGILQLLPLFLLASFYNASFSLHCSNSKKSLQQYLLLLHFLAPKHSEVASLEEVFLQKQGSKGFRLFSVLFIKATFTSSNNQPLEMINPSPPDLLKSGQNRLRKTHNPQIFKFHKL